MKNVKKRCFSLLLAFCVLAAGFGAAPPAARAASGTVYYAALGDSIAKGYGLADAPTQSYVSLVGDYLGTMPLNLAADGLTSGELSTILQSIQDGSPTALELAHVDVITLSIGSNDILGPFAAIIAEALNIDISGTTGAAILTAVQAALAASMANEATWAATLAALNTAFAAGAPSIIAATGSFSTNFPAILTKLRALAPHAEIYVTNLYNPYAGITLGMAPSQLDLGAVVAGAIGGMNSAISYSAAPYSNVHVLNVSGAFASGDVNANGTTSLDPHPSLAGHAKIAGLITASIAPLVASVDGTSYSSWACAAAAVPAGGTITLLRDITLAATDVLPAVACTIDGGTNRHQLTLSSDPHLQADITFKNIALDAASYAMLDWGSQTVSIDGKVAFSSKVTLSILTSLNVLSGATLDAIWPIVQNAVINGTLKCNEMTLIQGVLSGGGTIVFKTNAEDSLLFFYNSSVAADAAITLKAEGYTPTLGQLVAVHSQRDMHEGPVENINKLTLGSGFEGYVLSYDNEGRYLLAAASPPVTGDTTTTTPTATVSGSTATTTVTPTVTNGTAVSRVTAAQVTSAITAAKAAAKSTGGTAAVEIKAGTGAATTAKTAIPQTAIQALSSGVGALTVSSGVARLTFDAQALSTISAAATGDVSITAARVETSALPASAQAMIGGRPVYDFTVTSGGTAISQLGGTVTVSIPYTLTAGEDGNAVVIYCINTSGVPSLVPNVRYDAAAGTLIFTTTHFSTYAVGYNKISFTDVSAAAWYADAVTFLAARGVTGGTAATTFSPDATLTRGQFITLLLRAYGVAAVDGATDNFSDAGDTYYTGYLAAAKKLGVSSGVGGNNFAPEQAITRQELFTLLYNALSVLGKLPTSDSGKTLSDFADRGSIAPYAQTAMAALVRCGTVGGNNGRLDPAGTSTRAQMAQVLYHLLNV